MTDQAEALIVTSLCLRFSRPSFSGTGSHNSRTVILVLDNASLLLSYQAQSQTFSGLSIIFDINQSLGVSILSGMNVHIHEKHAILGFPLNNFSSHAYSSYKNILATIQNNFTQIFKGKNSFLISAIDKKLGKNSKKWGHGKYFPSQRQRSTAQVL